MKIAIYEGAGVAKSGLRYLLAKFPKAILVNANQLCQREILSNVSVFIMPGGRASFYHSALEGQANSNIRKFVEDKGIYVGICGGAYYGSTDTLFGENTPLEIRQQGELKFFKGIAVGPIFNKAMFAYEGTDQVSELGSCMVKLKTKNGNFSVYYNGGCYFQKAESMGAKVLARYGMNYPAIIRCSVGKGQALLSGVHIEYSDLLEKFLWNN